MVQLNSTFKYNISTLPQNEQDIFHQDYSDSQYSWEAFRAEILAALRSYYDNRLIAEGRKTIKLKPDTGLLAADIVVCIVYRRYEYYLGRNNQDFIEGMKFFVPSENRWVIKVLFGTNGFVWN